MMNAHHITNRPFPIRTWFEEVGTRLSTQSMIPVFLRVSMGAVAAASLVMFMSALLGMGGCATSDEVGHTKTVEKRVIDTPTEKVTVTETHEKDTKIVK